MRRRLTTVAPQYIHNHTYTRYICVQFKLIYWYGKRARPTGEGERGRRNRSRFDATGERGLATAGERERRAIGLPPGHSS